MQGAVNAGAQYVKTSTGFGTAGATADDVRLMKKAVGEGIGVKASGGIRSFEKRWRWSMQGLTALAPAPE